MEELTVGLRDLNGYQVTREDLEFLELDLEGVQDMLAQARPLGVTRDHFTLFVESLSRALAQDGLGACDVRLQGSAAFFFSGGPKLFPDGPDFLAQTYRDSTGAFPKAPGIVHAAYARLLKHWPSDRARPRRKVFDLFYRAGLLDEKSDLDVQISSEIAFDKVRCAMLIAYGSDRGIKYHKPNYNFIDPAAWQNVLLGLSDWESSMTQLLGRKVSVALFTADGPPRSSELWSSHFQNDKDWIISFDSMGG